MQSSIFNRETLVQHSIIGASIMARLKGKVAIVTGAARGLGEAIAKRLAEEGAIVVLTDVLVELGERSAASIPGAIFLEQDVSDELRWQEVIAETINRFGRLDILINNAGITRLFGIEDCTLEDFRLIGSVILEGTFLGCKYCLPALQASGSGAIVNISSLAGMRGVGLLPAYSAAKSGVHGLTRSIAMYCQDKGYNVRANAVAPGAHDTAMMQLGQEMMGSDPTMAKVIGAGVGQPVDVANLVLFLASEESRQITGQVMVIDNGASVR